MRARNKAIIAKYHMTTAENLLVRLNYNDHRGWKANCCYATPNFVLVLHRSLENSNHRLCIQPSTTLLTDLLSCHLTPVATFTSFDYCHEKLYIFPSGIHVSVSLIGTICSLVELNFSHSCQIANNVNRPFL